MPDITCSISVQQLIFSLYAVRYLYVYTYCSQYGDGRRAKEIYKKIGTTVNAMGQVNLPACRRLVSPRLEPPVSDRPSQRTNTIDHSACAVWSEKAHFAYQFSNRNVDTNQQSVRRNTCELRVSKIQFRRPVQLLFSTHTYTQEIFNRVI